MGDTRPQPARELRNQFARELESLESASRMLRDGSQEDPADTFDLLLHVCLNHLTAAASIRGRIERAEP